MKLATRLSWLCGGLGLFALLGPTGCGDAGPGAGTASAANDDIVINPYLVQLDQLPGDNKNIQVFADHLVFPAAGNAWLLTPQSVNALLCRDSCPGGYFLREVVSVEQQGNQIVVQTLPGKITDVVISGHLHYVLDATQGQAPAGGPSAPSGVLLPQETPETGSAPGGLESEGQDLSLYSASKTFKKDFTWGDKYANANIDLQGTVGVQLTLDLNIQQHWHWGFPPYSVSLASATLEATGTAGASAALTLTAQDSWSHTWTAPTESFDLGEFDVQAGPVPLVFFVTLAETPSAKAEASAKITAGASINVSEQIQVGVQYANGNWTPITKETPKLTYSVQQPVGKASAKITGQVDISLELLLYDSAGPTFSLTPDIGAEIDFSHDCSQKPPDVLSWFGFWGFDCSLGGKIDVLGDTLFDKSWTLFTEGPNDVLPGKKTFTDPLCPSNPDGGTAQDGGTGGPDGGSKHADGGSGSCTPDGTQSKDGDGADCCSGPEQWNADTDTCGKCIQPGQPSECGCGSDCCSGHWPESGGPNC